MCFNDEKQPIDNPELKTYKFSKTGDCLWK